MIHTLLLSPLVVIALFQQGPANIERVSWIAGCWEGRAANRVYTEQWMKPLGGLMLGISRTVAGERAVAYEFLQIKVDGADLFYVAKPSGQAEASFKLTRQSEREAIFENPQHDFPQRIIYRLQTDDSLIARTEGKSNGTDRAIDFPMKRVMCP